MNFDDLKEQLKARLLQLFDRVSESPAYLSVKDRYDTLSPSRQKAAVTAVIVVVLLIVFAIPFSSYLTSSENVANYESKKDLIRELLRAHKEASENSLTVSPPPIDSVRAQAEQAMAVLNLLPEQMRGVSIQPLNSPLVKASIVEGMVEVNTSLLNLRQVMNIATSLARIPGTKLKDLVMNANTRDPRYFDTVFRVVVFKGDPQAEMGAGGGDEPKGRGNSNPRPSKFNNNNGSIPPPPPPPPASPVGKRR